MVPVAQETTANTVRLPYSFSRRFSLVRSVAGDPPRSSAIALCFAGAAAGAERALYAAANRRGRI